MTPPIRSQTATALAAVYKSAQSHAETARAELVAALPPQMRQVLEFVERRCAKGHKVVTGIDVYNAMKFWRCDAGNMLKELCDYGLLERSLQENDLGYGYKPKGKG